MDFSKITELATFVASAEDALFSIEDKELFLAAIATIVDEYAIKYGHSDEEVNEWYRRILEVRPGVLEEIANDD